MSIPMPTIQQLNRAREAFTEIEPRDFFYGTARRLVESSIPQGYMSEAPGDLGDLVSALMVLLQTWNVSYYRFKGRGSGFSATQHFDDVETLIKSHWSAIPAFRERTIADYSETDRKTIEAVFTEFEMVLGPVGAAKCLHLLAPRFFPLWDRAIAQAYDLALGKRGTNADRYRHFMEITQRQCQHIGGEEVLGRNPLKAIDEYNYCSITRRIDI